MPRVLVSDDGTFRTYDHTDAGGNVIGRAVEQYVFPAEQTNAETIRTRAATALAGNTAFIGTVATRRTQLANGKASAQAMSGANVGNVAAAQAQIRAAGVLLVQVATALDVFNDQAEAAAKQSNAVIRLLLGALDSTTDT